ncbi:MAG: 1-acyl-sn-glycerol-3-phosphate acyltransferase [Francisellaceae bacterium]|jgi:1-acyl-sn-glycerol-3-phosphate acyltransferase
MRYIINAVLIFRQLIFLGYAGIVLFLFGTVSPLLYFLRAPRSLVIRMPHFWSLLWHIGIFFILWVKIEVKGGQNIPKKPCIYVCKHQSKFETFFLNKVLPRSVFVFKQELLSSPFLGWGLKYSGNIAVDRTKGVKALKDVIKYGKEKLANGISVIIFPEGTRAKAKEHPKFHKSGLMLANASGGDVVLVAHNSANILPTGDKALKVGSIKVVMPGKIKIVISEPIDARNYNLTELNDYCYNWIKEQMIILEK